MKRIFVNLTAVVLTFTIGILSWFSNPFRLKPAEPSKPLRLTVLNGEPLRLTVLNGEVTALGRVDYDILVENLGSKTVHGYALGFACRYASADELHFLNPVPDRELLEPGESMIRHVSCMGNPREQFKVWADLVHFTDGTNWGPNNSRTERYVRGLE